MKKASIHTNIIVAGALAIAATIGLSRQLEAEEMSLRLADSFPTTHYVPRELTKPWIDKMVELTGGKVKFEYYPAEQLGKAKDLLSLTQSGVADVGYVAPSYVSDKLPLATVAELPESFTGSCQGTNALWTLAKPGGLLDEKELKPLGVRALFVLVLAPYQIFTSNAKIEGLKSFAGLKIRVSGSAKELTARKLGAIPVQITAPETREALSRGTIDAILYPNSSIAPYGLVDQVAFATKNVNFGSYVVTYLMSRDRYAALPEDIRTAMEEAGTFAMKVGCEAVDRLDAEDAGKIAAAGATYVGFDESESKKLDALMSTVGSEWAAKLDQRGLGGTEILNAFRAALKSPAN